MSVVAIQESGVGWIREVVLMPFAKAISILICYFIFTWVIIYKFKELLSMALTGIYLQPLVEVVASALVLGVICMTIYTQFEKYVSDICSDDLKFRFFRRI